jgi:hypothetical protein
MSDEEIQSVLKEARVFPPPPDFARVHGPGGRFAPRPEPPRVIVRQPDPEQDARQTQLLLAIGSSLVVEPAASIPRVAKDHGATLVILNATETPLDCLADVLLHLPIGETLRRAAELVP